MCVLAGVTGPNLSQHSSNHCHWNFNVKLIWQNLELNDVLYILYPPIKYTILYNIPKVVPIISSNPMPLNSPKKLWIWQDHIKHCRLFTSAVKINIKNVQFNILAENSIISTRYWCKQMLIQEMSMALSYYKE